MAVTKSHKTSQAPTFKPLTPEQQNAIDLLILGKSDREVAEGVGVAREAVTRWRSDNPLFIAELNRQRQALWADARERLRALVGKAVAVIEQAMQEGDLGAVIGVLKAVKLYGEIGAPEGPTNPDAILRARTEAQARRELGDESPL
jgi:hypothetical protein